jgi:hypothetical protein
MATRPEKSLSKADTRVKSVGGGYLMQRLVREQIGAWMSLLADLRRCATSSHPDTMKHACMDKGRTCPRDSLAFLHHVRKVRKSFDLLFQEMSLMQVPKSKARHNLQLTLVPHCTVA